MPDHRVTTIVIEVAVDREHPLLEAIAEHAIQEATQYGIDAYVGSETRTVPDA